MAIYRWVLQLSNRNCRVFVRHLVFLPNFVTLPFELTRTNCSAQISALEGDWIKMKKMIISFSLSLHYPLRCGGASLPWPHCCTWKIRYNQGLIRFGLWIWVTWLQVEYPTIWGLNPTMKIPNFSFILYFCITTGISDNFREAFLKRITRFIELQVQHIIYFQTQLYSFIIVNVSLLFVQNMGTSPQSLALRISISIASAAPSSKKQLNHLLSPSAKPSVHCQANYRGGA